MNDGYLKGDICILMRKNIEGQRIARHLKTQGIPVSSSDSLLLSGNEHVHLLLYMLQFVYQKERPKSDLFVLQHLLIQNKRLKDFHSMSRAYRSIGAKALLPLFKDLDI